MKILHVIPNLTQGGAEQVLINILPSIQAQGHSCEVAVLEPNLALAPRLAEHGIPVRVLPTHHRWNLVANARALRKVVADNGFDVVHAHLFFPAMYTALGGGGKAIRFVTFHNLDYDYFPPKTPWLKARRWLHGRAMRTGVHQTIAVSRAVAAHFEQQLSIDQVEMIPNAFPVERLREIAEENREGAAERYNLPTGPFTIVTHGRAVRAKGHLDLLAAYSLLAREGRTFQAWIIGDGPQAGAIQAAIRDLHLEEHVTYRGNIPNRDLMGVLSRADLFVSSSHYEGFSLALAEAMAVGLPAVVTRAGGMVDVVADGEAGVVVPVSDPTSLAREIGRMMDNPSLRQSTAEKGQRRITTEYSADAVATQLITLYQSTATQLPRSTVEAASYDPA